MKPTMSADGELRFTIQTSHRIDRNWLICLVAQESAYTPFEPKTKKALWAAVRYELTYYGSDRAYYWSEDTDKEDANELERRAEQVINRLYPELIPQTGGKS